MKLITAIIRTHRLDRVREELMASDITRITVSRAAGHGAQLTEEIYRGKKVIPGLIPKVRIEIAVNEEFLDDAINAIIRSARSAETEGENGAVGDGKIFVTNLEKCIRIRNGEDGGDAI